MKKPLSEKDLDNLMHHLVCDAVADEQKTNEIANSPALWWGVKRRISDQETRSPWPPSKILRRWLAIAVPAACAILLIALVFLLRPETSTPRPELVMDPLRTDMSVPVNPADPEIKETVASQTQEPSILSEKTQSRSRAVQPRAKRPRRAEPSAPLTSEFIALSYAASPESGQTVRVRVPRSMMVTVGLVPAVAKPESLVDAEVLIGDDGLTHAIRFISNK